MHRLPSAGCICLPGTQVQFDWIESKHVSSHPLSCAAPLCSRYNWFYGLWLLKFSTNRFWFSLKAATTTMFMERRWAGHQATPIIFVTSGSLLLIHFYRPPTLRLSKLLIPRCSDLCLRPWVSGSSLDFAPLPLPSDSSIQTWLGQRPGGHAKHSHLLRLCLSSASPTLPLLLQLYLLPIMNVSGVFSVHSERGRGCNFGRSGLCEHTKNKTNKP